MKSTWIFKGWWIFENFVEYKQLWFSILSFAFWGVHRGFGKWKKWGGSLKVLKVHLCGLSKTTFENSAFELNLKEFVEKHLDYIISSIEILWKLVFLNDLLVQNKNLRVLRSILLLVVTCFSTYLLKSSLRKWFLRRYVGKFCDHENFVTTSPRLKCEVINLWSMKSFSFLGILLENVF